MNNEIFDILSLVSVEMKIPIWELYERKWSEIMLQYKALKRYYDKVIK